MKSFFNRAVSFLCTFGLLTFPAFARQLENVQDCFHRDRHEHHDKDKHHHHFRQGHHHKRHNHSGTQTVTITASTTF